MSATGSNIQPFNSIGNRLINDIPAAPVVSSWNGLTGDVKGTLAEIFAFGVDDDPDADNVWAMGQGRRRFKSTDTGSGSFWAVNDVFFEDFDHQGDGRVGAWLTVRSPGPILGTTFRTDSIYLAGFDGNIADGVEWGNRGYLTNDLDDAHQTGDLFWRQNHVGANFFGNDPVSLPPPPDGRRQVVYAIDELAAVGNFASGNRTARIMSGWGQQFVYTIPQHHGITPGHINVTSDRDLTLQTGDGSAFWIIFGDSNHEDDNRLRGSYDAHMLTDDPVGAWGLGLWAWDGSTIFQIAELDHLVGMQLFRGGLQLPNVDTTTAPVGGALAAKIVWDDTLQKVRISVDGGAYVDLSTFS